MSGVLDFSGVRLTRHARAVMRSRCVDVDEVIKVVNQPQIVEPHGGRWRFVRDGLCAVVLVEKGAATVVTVLLRRGDQWTDEDARER